MSCLGLARPGLDGFDGDSGFCFGVGKIGGRVEDGLGQVLDQELAEDKWLINGSGSYENCQKSC